MNKYNNELEFLDILNIISFVIGVMNYGENLTQGDKQDIMNALDSKTSLLLEDIHSQLQKQNELLEDMRHEFRRYLIKNGIEYDTRTDDTRTDGRVL